MTRSRWLVFARRKVQANGHGGWVMGPGAEVGAVYEPDKAAALAEGERVYGGPKIEIVVCSQASWDCSGPAERARLLGNFTPDNETKDRKLLRRTMDTPTNLTHD